MFGLTPQQLDEIFRDDKTQHWGDKQLLQHCPSSPDDNKHVWVEVSFYSGIIACKHCDMDKPVYDKSLKDIEERDRRYERY